MGRLFKTLFILIVLGAIGLVGYAYIGPMFGADFSPPTQEVREQLILNAD